MKGNLVLILIDRIAFSLSNFSVFTEVLSVVNKQGKPISWCEPQRGPMSCFCFFHPAIVSLFARTTPQWGVWVGVKYIFSLIFDGSPLWHGSNIPLTHGLLSREMMATSA
jgi:hypothetical protein